MSPSKQSRWIARRRAAHVAASLCRDCGAKVEPEERTGKVGRPPTGYRCKPCREKRR